LADVDVLAHGEGRDAVRDDFSLGWEEGRQGVGEEAGGEGEVEGAGVADEVPGVRGEFVVQMVFDSGLGFVG